MSRDLFPREVLREPGFSVLGYHVLMPGHLPRHRDVEQCFCVTAIFNADEHRSSDLALRSQAGLLDEVEGAPLAVDHARQVFRPRRGNSDRRAILAFAVLALPGFAIDYDVWMIAAFDVEPLYFVKIQGRRFVRRRLEGLLAPALGISGHDHRLEHAFLRRGDAHADFYMTASAVRVVVLAEAGILPDRFISDLSSLDGPPPARFEPLGEFTLLLAAREERDGIDQTRFIRAEPTFTSANQACQSQQ